MDEPEPKKCDNCDRLTAKLKSLEETVDRLLKRIEELERAGKRQADPFSKGDPKKSPKRPGRKPGGEYGRQALRPRPERSTRSSTYLCQRPVLTAAVTSRRSASRSSSRRTCPRSSRSSAASTSTSVAAGAVTAGSSAPPAPDLRRSRSGRRPARTEPNVAFATALNKVYGPSWAKVAHLIEKGFGVKASASAYCRAATRLGEKLDPTYDALARRVAASPIVYPDETGWRVGGHRRWLWVFVAGPVTLYRIAASRGARSPRRSSAATTPA
ncbi:MAG: transposase [Planctomycetes bacterium]|nr:transposase [Planctomycetota bacterium]